MSNERRRRAIGELGRRAVSLVQKRASGLLGEVAETMGTRAVVLLLGLITSVIVNRALGPSGRGEFAVAAATAALLTQFGNLGLHASNTYLLGKDRTRFPALVMNSVVISALMLPVAAVLMTVGALLAAGSFPADDLLRVLAVVTVPVALLLLLLQNLLLADGDVRGYNGLELLQRLSSVTLLALLAVTATMTAVWAYGGIVLATAITVGVALRRISSRQGGWSAPSLPLFRRSLAYGLKAYVAVLAAFLTMRVDVLLVSNFRGDRETGLYSTAAGMADLVLTLPIVVGTLLFPRLSAMPGAGEQRALTMKTLRTLAMVLAPGIGVAVLAAAPLINVLYGREFGGAVPPFLWLLPGAYALGLAVILNNYYAARGMPPVAYVTAIASAAANIVLNLFMIPRWGASGAAIASTVAYVGMLLSLATAFVRDSAAQEGARLEERPL